MERENHQVPPIYGELEYSNLTDTEITIQNITVKA